MNDFEKGFGAGFIGYWLGHKLDQTRFGVWFNTNPIINFIWYLGKLILTGISILLLIIFICCVISAFAN